MMGVLFEDGTYDYGKPYYDEYVVREKSISGIVLNTLRVNLVKKYADSRVLDIGCGAGSFIKYMWMDNDIKVYGYDVNDYTISWLEGKGLYYNAPKFGIRGFDVVTFFDSFEHIRDHKAILGTAEKNQIVIISTPTYETLDDVKRSKHYKPGEHLWYFTDVGLSIYMIEHGFDFVERTDIEIRAGREGIHTYVFRKRR